MRRLRENQQGFTLVELMAAVLITVIIVAAMMTTVVTSNRANVVNSQVADTQQNVRLAIDLLSRDIKLAGLITTRPIRPPMRWGLVMRPSASCPKTVGCFHRTTAQCCRYRPRWRLDGAAGDEHDWMDLDGSGRWYGQCAALDN